MTAAPKLDEAKWALVVARSDRTPQEFANAKGWVELWIKRLCDPSSKQAKCKLKTEDGMCCLGHLADLFIINGYGEWVYDNLLRYNANGPLRVSSSSFCGHMFPIREGATWGKNSLSQLNDIEGKTLPEIAAYIAMYPDKLVWPWEK